MKKKRNIPLNKDLDSANAASPCPNEWSKYQAAQKAFSEQHIAIQYTKEWYTYKVNYYKCNNQGDSSTINTEYIQTRFSASLQREIAQKHADKKAITMAALVVISAFLTLGLKHYGIDTTSNANLAIAFLSGTVGIYLYKYQDSEVGRLNKEYGKELLDLFDALYYLLKAIKTEHYKIDKSSEGNSSQKKRKLLTTF